MKTKIKKLIETSKVIKVKEGFTYLMLVDTDKVQRNTIREMVEYSHDLKIKLLIMPVYGDPNEAAAIYEVET